MSYVEDRLQEIANAIREKEGSVDPIPAPDFATRILDIQTGVDTSDATATAEDILERKTAYVNGVKIRGTMQNVGAATPTISFDTTTGIVTASTEQKRGFVDASQKSASKQLNTQAGKTVTPSTIARTAVAKGYYTTGDVLVAGDEKLIPSNIKEGTSIFGVTGTAPTEKKVKILIKNNQSQGSITPVLFSDNPFGTEILNGKSLEIEYTANRPLLVYASNLIRLSSSAIKVSPEPDYYFMIIKSNASEGDINSFVVYVPTVDGTITIDPS